MRNPFDSYRLKKMQLDQARKKMEEELEKNLPEEEAQQMAELEMIKDRIKALNYGLSEEQLEKIIDCMIIEETFEEITNEMYQRGLRRLSKMQEEDAKRDNGQI